MHRGGDRAERESDPEMDPQDDVHVVERPGRHHRRGASHTLFGRLEDDADLAGEPTVPGEPLEEVDADRHVAVVPARVHHAVVSRGEAFAGG
nr:hypothetical protein DA06_16100 [Georgenia sp. SUBG003]